ncbi:MAG: Shedu immune nuclease family protein [Syntrophobacteraceae bacterium]
MIDIKAEGGKLLLYYTSEAPPFNWVREKLDERDSVVIAKTFHFTKDDLLSEGLNEDEEEVDEYEQTSSFILATDANEYYQIKATILGTRSDVFLSKELHVRKETFIATRGISIFSKIDQLVNEPIVIGGSRDNAVPLSDFKNLLKTFPTTTELEHYAHSRISLILKEYLVTMTDAQKKLNDYLKKKQFIKSTPELPELYEYEAQKYEYIRGRIKEMLQHSEAYSENDWQEMMLKFILLIFPKYVAVLKNVNIKDHYSKSHRITDRYIDLALVDTNGNVDIIEIKKPYESSLLSSNKYRDNFTPKKELSGTIMQAEKYLFHLNKWGVEGEKKIGAKHAAQLPSGMKIKITNPKAIVIVGRSTGFSKDQNFDFEIMKRKYANILDIITYDDLLNRLKNIIEKLRKSVPHE